MLMRKKNGQSIGGLPNTVIALVVVGFVIALSLILLVKLKDTNNTSADVNTSIDEVSSAIQEIPTFLSLIVLAFIMVIVIGAILLIQRLRA